MCVFVLLPPPSSLSSNTQGFVVVRVKSACAFDRLESIFYFFQKLFPKSFGASSGCCATRCRLRIFERVDGHKRRLHALCVVLCVCSNGSMTRDMFHLFGCMCAARLVCESMGLKEPPSCWLDDGKTTFLFYFSWPAPASDNARANGGGPIIAQVAKVCSINRGTQPGVVRPCSFSIQLAGLLITLTRGCNNPDSLSLSPSFRPELFCAHPPTLCSDWKS